MPTWTTTPPTVPGVYWWRCAGRTEVCEVRPLGVTDAHMERVGVGTLGAYDPGSDSPTPVGRAGGEWWGPVAPPGDGGAVVSDSDRGPATADGRAWKGV